MRSYEVLLDGAKVHVEGWYDEDGAFVLPLDVIDGRFVPRVLALLEQERDA